MVSLVWTVECALGSLKDTGVEGRGAQLILAFSHSVCFSTAPCRALAQRARRVGELRESDDWSPLLLLRRWALEQDSEEGEGLSGSSMLG